MMVYHPLVILLVEDEEAHAALTRRAIRKAGNANQVDVVGDGEKALDYLYNRKAYADQDRYPRPGLILLDLNLPGISGIEVLKTIKSDPSLRSIPVVVLTTSERDDDIRQCYMNHANSYLTKPVGCGDFEEKIKSLDYYWLILNQPQVLHP